MYKTSLFILSLFLSGIVIGQEEDKGEAGKLMRKEAIGGLNFNAHGATGWGIAGEYGFQKNYKYKHLIGFTLTNIRHPKEYKIFAQSGSPKGYYFGKLESLVSFRPTFGGKRILFKAKRENGIEIGAKFHIGPSIGLVKPVYLKIDKINAQDVDERYDPDVHNFGNIASRSSWFKGLGEANFRAGIFTKVGFDFNFSTIKESISGGEIGFMCDYFPGKEIEMVHNNDNSNFFASLYLQFNLGQKIY